ncbi:Hypothetical predicted protein [Paramuricea clavata]|uniref:Uncharacterized protein n=1 Tax=Paramuricea clavata TaxID=317549 RepID=A0A7D9LV95_PARCT|nr:Hypothetical predicted protein [Paramuricea clavata]
MMMKTIIATFLICFAAALPRDEENPWTKLLDDQIDNDELDVIQNDKKGKWTENNCCYVKGFVYKKHLVNKKSKCIRSLKVDVSPNKLKLAYKQHLDSTTTDLGGNLILHNGILYEATKAPKRCRQV